jgi:hypothetical protein
MATVISSFSYAHSLIPFVFQYISLPCYCFSVAHFPLPFVNTQREWTCRVLIA